jgi:DNA polymerase-3 subunit epsilon
MITQPLSFVDIETTGSSANGDRIIEIGILRVENGKVVNTLKTLLNPHSYVPLFIQDMTGIRQSELKEAPSFQDMMQEIYEILEGSIFVAHNARFDYGFIRNEFKRHGYTYTAKVLCTVKLSRMLFPMHQRHNLDTIINRFGLVCESRHRAYDDAKVLWDFVQKIENEYPTLPLQTTIDHLIREPSLPRHIESEQIDFLEEIPGVYLFYGNDSDLPLYIGKSRSLRNRILSHFSGDNTSTTEMVISQQVQRIDTRTTAGELGALILEAQLIKEMKPMYNRRLRSLERLTIVKESTNKDGYKTVTMHEVDDVPFMVLEEIVHIAKSKAQAKQFLEHACKEQGLCKKLLGIEKTKSCCFDYKLGKCKGACLEEEPVDLYNARFALAFEGSRIPKWPYPGPILVTETDQNRQLTEVFLFDKWCCLAKLDEADVQNLDQTSYEYEFDLDTYKILKRFLQKKMVKVSQLSKQQTSESISY